jgi:voltage-gated potassium channel
MHLKAQFKTFWHLLQHENLHRVLLFIGCIVVISAAGITFLEEGMTLSDGAWWSVVTLTTVGYGDISPKTYGGRLMAMVVMFVGIGFLGTLSATIASMFIDRKLQEDLGMSSFDFRDHIIICEWNERARVILEEFRLDPQTVNTPVVLIAAIERKPINDKNLFFVQGNVTDETLKRANLAEAKTVVVLGDQSADAMTRDAKVVLTTLTIESINPHVYTIAELVDADNVPYCERANANEIVVTNELNSRLISRAAIDHGITKVVTELLASDQGHEIYKMAAPAPLIGQPFIDVLLQVKRERNYTVVAIQKGNVGEVLANPPVDYRIAEEDYLVVIAQERPHW